MNCLATWQKLGLLVLPCLLLAAFPAALHMRDLNSDVTKSELGASGSRSARAVLEVVRLVQQHRGLSNGVLAGNGALIAQREAKKIEVRAALDKMLAAVPRGSPSLTRESATIAAAFGEIAAAVDARAIPVAESFQRHTQLIALALRHLDAWLDFHLLTFEEDPAAHYLVMVTYEHLPALTEAMGQARAHGTAMLAGKAPSARDRLFAAALLDRASDRLAAVRNGLAKAGESRPDLKERLRTELDRLEGETRRVIDTARRELVDASAMTYDAAEYFSLTTRGIDGQFQLLDRLAGELVQTLAARAASRTWMRDAMAAGGGLLLLVVLGCAVTITRAITRPLSRAVEVAGRIAAGRLDNEIRAEGEDGVARLLAALERMQAQLADIVSRIQVGGLAIREASEQTAAGNSELSSRTEEQASTIEETAANMEELTSTVRQNAQSAGAAISLAAEAAQQARAGGELVASVVASMGTIAESSRQVAEITESIDGIAFQTNLLALNAAVEAARAGSHGRGFAVVASEVRILAQRCAQAAKQIRSLVKKSGDQIEEGRRHAAVAGAAVERLVEAVGTVAQRMNEIASASAQQRQGIEQVNQAVTQLDAVTQRNAALVEEAAANAMSLERLAAELAAVAATFQTGERALAPRGHAAISDATTAGYLLSRW